MAGGLKPAQHDIPEFVTLHSTNPEKLKLPNPSYFALHATSCRVTQKSGVAEYLDWMDEAVEEVSSRFMIPEKLNGDFPAILMARLLDLQSLGLNLVH